MLFMDLIKHILEKVMYFSMHNCCKVYDNFSFALYVFWNNCFRGERDHRNDQGEEVCDGWFLVEVRSGHQ